jgi:lysocardiolipin and lysophospholipid acyltransferase
LLDSLLQEVFFFSENVLAKMAVIRLLKRIHGYIRGLSYCLLWYGSICLGFFFLYAPLLPLLLVHPPLFRKGIDIIQSCWEAFNTSLLQLIFGVEFVLTGDNINSSDNAVIVMNHPTRTDWNFFYPALFHTSSSHNNKIVLKESVRKIPGAGWAMALTRFVFLKRDWNQDKTTMDNMMDYFATTKDEGPKTILLFPEGTNLTAESRAKSKQFADKNNIKEFKYLLHPRTAGFVHIVHGMLERKMLNAVYDCTIAYPDVTPHRETDIMKGRIPSRVNIHIVRHPLPQVPTTYVGLEKWIQELWFQKESQLAKFSESKEFMPLTREQRLPRSTTTLQPLCVLAWLTFMYWSLHALLTSVTSIIWFIIISALFHYSENYTPGFQKLELDLHFKRLKQKCMGSGEKSNEEDSQDDFEHLKED